MNTHLRPPDVAMTTQAAEGLLRRRWTVAELEAMHEAGILSDERYELIGGEVVPMSPKGIRHEVLKKVLAQHWIQRLPNGVDLITETTFRLTPVDFLEPDFLFWPRSVRLADIAPANVLLVVEVADSTLAYDRGRKARLYAGFGVRELWVINAVTLATTLFRSAGPDGYADETEVESSVPLVPPFAPELAVTLAALDLD